MKTRLKARQLRVALAQINPTLGDFKSNGEKVLEFANRALERRCDLVVFPEACLFGYHPFDLLERTSVVEQQLNEFKKLQKKWPKGIAGIIGIFAKNPSKRGRPYFNSAALIEKGKKARVFHKQLLPTGDVFDEARFIQSGKVADNFFTFKGHKMLVTICEDIWAWSKKDQRSVYSINPIEQIRGKRLDLVVNLSASPFYPNKHKRRLEIVRKTAHHFKAPMVYVNLVGAQDEIIFDGGSFAVDRAGNEILRCARFQEDINVFDIGANVGGLRSESEFAAEPLRQAIVLGIQDFCRKTGIQKVHLGISGGIDSALVACLAVDALGPSRVRGLSLKGPFTSDLSEELAAALAKNLGIELLDFPIDPAYQFLSKQITEQFDLSEFSTLHENIQARLRGLAMMAYANKEHSLLLSTSNKSELASGYATLYGDMCGALMPIGDLTKTQVYELAHNYNREREIIPDAIIKRPPSAELRANQKDQDSLPPYTDLDKSVVRIVELGLPARSETDRFVLRALANTEFKRWQAPPILKLSRRGFGRGRRLPIAHSAKLDG